jgi:hypothetical protein
MMRTRLLRLLDLRFVIREVDMVVHMWDVGDLIIDNHVEVFCIVFEVNISILFCYEAVVSSHSSIATTGFLCLVVAKKCQRWSV